MSHLRGLGWARTSLALLVAVLVTSPLVRGYNDTQECSSCSIYILDLSSFAHTHGYPVCDLDKVVVDPTTGVVYLKENDTGIEQKVGHQFGTHSAPWYLMKAIKASSCYVDDISKANVVYVYDYCYYIWWLAHIHSALGEKVVDTPGDYLIKGWTALLQLPRWQHNDGRDFVFYDSHPGFAQGTSAPAFLGMFCNEFRHAVHIVVETAQRNVCQSFLEIRKMLIAPYVPNVVNSTTPWAFLKQPSNPLAERNLTVYFKGKCTPQTERYIGKKMRHALVKEVGGVRDTEIECSDPTLGGSHEPYAVAFDKMRRSVFCLVLPGDAQSTRRLSEIFLAGCVPVFIGPPYNTMPFAEDVDYISAGLFYNITNYKRWLSKDMQWEVHPTERAAHGQEAEWWLPDADISSAVVTEKNFGSMMSSLRDVSKKEITQKLKAMEAERHKFHFQEQMADPPNPLNIIIKRICQQFRYHHVGSKPHREAISASSARQRRAHNLKEDDGTGASTSLGNAWLKIFTQGGDAPDEEGGEDEPLGGAIRTRGNSWHPFSFKEGVLDMDSTGSELPKSSIPDLDLA